jgi:hypothetical protein
MELRRNFLQVFWFLKNKKKQNNRDKCSSGTPEKDTPQKKFEGIPEMISYGEIPIFRNAEAQEIICYHSTSTAQIVDDKLETNHEEPVLFVEIAMKPSANKKAGATCTMTRTVKEKQSFLCHDPWKNKHGT